MSRERITWLRPCRMGTTRESRCLLHEFTHRMTFHHFITTQPPQHDRNLARFADMVKNDPGFPKTDDIEELARYLYMKLDDDLTAAFQKSVMIWQYVRNDFKNNDSPDMLRKLNIIIELQNNTPDYPWPRPIHKVRVTTSELK